MLTVTPEQAFEALDHAINESPPEQLPILSSALAARLASVASRQLEAAAVERAVKAAPDENLSLPEAAQRLSVSESWLYKNSGKLPFRVKVGARVLFSSRGLERWLRQRQGAR